MTTTTKVVVGVALLAGLAYVARAAKSSSCTDTAQCGPGKICWQGRCVERGTGSVTPAYSGGVFGWATDVANWFGSSDADAADESFLDWALGPDWLAETGPVTSPSQVP